MFLLYPRTLNISCENLIFGSSFWSDGFGGKRVMVFGTDSGLGVVIFEIKPLVILLDKLPRPNSIDRLISEVKVEGLG